MVAHACTSSTLGGRGRWMTCGQEFENSLANMVKPHLFYKYKNELGVVAGTCNPSYSGGWGRRIAWFQLGDQPRQHSETLSLQKNQLGMVVTHLWSQLLRRLRWEDCLSPGGWGCSELWSHHWTLAWATEQDSLIKKEIFSWFHFTLYLLLNFSLLFRKSPLKSCPYMLPNCPPFSKQPLKWDIIHVP